MAPKKVLVLGAGFVQKMALFQSLTSTENDAIKNEKLENKV